jgi:hypothetical protein
MPRPFGTVRRSTWPGESLWDYLNPLDYESIFDAPAHGAAILRLVPRAGADAPTSRLERIRNLRNRGPGHNRGELTEQDLGELRKLITEVVAILSPEP